MAVQLARTHESCHQCFELCRLDEDPECNLSHASLTSNKALTALRELPKTDPKFFKELYQLDDGVLEDKCGDILEQEPSEDDDSDTGPNDSSDVPVCVLKELVMNSKLSGTDSSLYEVNESGSVQTVAPIEMEMEDGPDDVVDEFVHGVNRVNESVELGRGRRKRAKPKHFFEEEWESY